MHICVGGLSANKFNWIKLNGVELWFKNEKVFNCLDQNSMSRKSALSQSSFLLRFSVERNPADTKDHIFKPGHYFLF